MMGRERSDGMSDELDPDAVAIEALERLLEPVRDGRASPSDVAPAVATWFSTHPGINMEMGRTLRRVLDSLATETGSERFPDEPAADRHAQGITRLSGAEDRLAAAVIELGSGNVPYHLNLEFRAATETRAQQLAARWSARSAVPATIRTPAQSDSHDWRVECRTPALRWTPGLVAEWMGFARTAPIGDEASCGGWGLLDVDSPPTA
jgi:hypothetical protein